MTEVQDTALVLTGPPGFGPPVEGRLLVSTDAFSPRYDLDRATGIISRQGHCLAGASIADRVLVIPVAKGGVAAGWAFYDLVKRGITPRALICRRTNPVMVQGCILAGIPIMHELTPDPVTTLRTGDRVRVDPGAGTVTVLGS
jgi:predicted aconitase with swiveling domain